MIDRGIKKYRPFNAVVPVSELLKDRSIKDIPTISRDQIEENEEVLKTSFYTGKIIEITYYEHNKEMNIKGIVKKIDSVKKNISIENKTINFRQIYKVKFYN